MAIRPPPHQSALRLTASPQGEAFGEFTPVHDSNEHRIMPHKIQETKKA